MQGGAASTSAGAASSSRSGAAMQPLRKLLGVNSLIKGPHKTRTHVPVASLEGKPLLLLFSAQWCPSCRLLKPRLVEFYNKMKAAGKEFELVYLPADRNEEEFEQAFEAHPWLAVPLREKRTHTRLNTMCGVDGIPKLVLVSATGKILSTEARKLMARDPDGDQFPWVPPTVFELLKDVRFYAHDGQTVSFDDVKAKEDGFAIYFAASWIRQCRFFTPKLVSTYAKMKEAGRDMEIIFCAIERDQEAFEDFWAEMPFPCLPPNHPANTKLRAALGIRNVPTLVTIKSATGEIINADAVSIVEDDPDGLRFPWKPKELPPVSRFYPSHDIVSAVHENICVVLFVNGAANKVSPMQEFSRAAVLWDATRNAESENAEEKVRFFTVDEDPGERSFMQSVLGVLRLQAPLHGEASLVLFCLVNRDRQLLPAQSMNAQDIDRRVTAFRRRQFEELGDQHAVTAAGAGEGAAASDGAIPETPAASATTGTTPPATTGAAAP